MIRTLVLYIICMSVVILSSLEAVDNYFAESWSNFYWNILALSLGIAGIIGVIVSTTQEEDYE